MDMMSGEDADCGEISTKRTHNAQGIVPIIAVPARTLSQKHPMTPADATSCAEDQPEVCRIKPCIVSGGAENKLKMKQV
jgi:hypothetical protein